MNSKTSRSLPSHLLLALALASLLGCQTLPPIDPVQSTLVNLVPTQGTVWETSATLTVRLENENPVPVHVSGAVHKIYFNGKYLGKGMFQGQSQVPAFGSTTQSLPIYLRNLTLLNQFRKLADTPLVQYELQSTLHASTPDTSPNSTFKLKSQDSGELDLREFFPASPTP